MDNLDNLNQLQLRMCELKIEKRRIDTQIKNMLLASKSIDFFQAKKLSIEKSGVNNQIKIVQNKIMPDIIA